MIINVRYLIKCLRAAVIDGTITKEFAKETIEEARERNNYLLNKLKNN
jgi:hypothetical protein